MLRKTAFLVFLAGPVMGQEAVTDAFGIREPGPSPREAWSGWVETVSEDGVKGTDTWPEGGTTVLFYLGPNSLVAGGEAGQAAALVLDPNGNLVADGSEVVLTVGGEAVARPTRSGIASRSVLPGIAVGQFHAGAAIVGRQSARAEYAVHADLASISLAWGGALAPVRAEDFHLLTTAPMADRFGNPVPDGIGGTARLDHPGGKVSLVPMVVVGGTGRGQLLVRDVPDMASAQAGFGPSTTGPLEIAVDRPLAVGTLALRAVAEADTGATRLTVGPFLTDAGHALNEGSPVGLRITTRAGRIIEQQAWVFKGEVNVLTLAGAADFPLQVEVTSALGTTRHQLDSAQGVAP